MRMLTCELQHIQPGSICLVLEIINIARQLFWSKKWIHECCSASYLGTRKPNQLNVQLCATTSSTPRTTPRPTACNCPYKFAPICMHLGPHKFTLIYASCTRSCRSRFSWRLNKCCNYKKQVLTSQLVSIPETDYKHHFRIQCTDSNRVETQQNIAILRLESPNPPQVPNNKAITFCSLTHTYT